LLGDLGVSSLVLLPALLVGVSSSVMWTVSIWLSSEVLHMSFLNGSVGISLFCSVNKMVGGLLFIVFGGIAGLDSFGGGGYSLGFLESFFLGTGATFFF